ncbi:hypothetical protein [Haladaptatus sp. R4]|uniref:hypothetical protein n=1 Tax=Haladaptatus sp. R4 TaxID=1679489 RepID=UPI00167FFEB4|nr:hypothetical protein [Haladaptatus sp. R4]
MSNRSVSNYRTASRPHSTSCSRLHRSQFEAREVKPSARFPHAPEITPAVLG